MTDSIDEILNDKDVDVVVEVIGGIEPAHQYIVDALKHKKHVITANKAVIAQYMDEFTKVLLKMTPSSTLNQASVVGSHGFKVWKEHCESTMWTRFMESSMERVILSWIRCIGPVSRLTTSWWKLNN